jgi:hypothetical protein
MQARRTLPLLAVTQRHGLPLSRAIVATRGENREGGICVTALSKALDMSRTYDVAPNDTVATDDRLGEL